tara:strand:+ start:6431 stop:6802 length:372 start_codon:yes stop_codon:yes gene_type:complete
MITVPASSLAIYPLQEIALLPREQFFGLCKRFFELYQYIVNAFHVVELVLTHIILDMGIIGGHQVSYRQNFIFNRAELISQILYFFGFRLRLIKIFLSFGNCSIVFMDIFDRVACRMGCDNRG